MDGAHQLVNAWRVMLLAAQKSEAICPRGWPHSPLHSQFGTDQRYDSLLSPTQKKVQEGHLHDYCSANTMETKMMIAEKMQEEKERQEKLRKARETCLPCAGTWPNCECGGNVQALKNRDIKKLQVTRAGDEADGVDQTLPRNDTIKSLLNYGKPALGSGRNVLDLRSARAISA